MGQPDSLYTTFLNHLNQLYGKTGFRQISLTLQNASSNMYVWPLLSLFDSLHSKKAPQNVNSMENLNYIVKMKLFVS